MKALKFTEPHKAEIVSVPDPVVSENDDIVIQLKTAGICASDVMAFKGTHPYRVPPVITGHECAGEVISIGKNVKTLKVGDRVAVEPHLGCGECIFCLHGEYQECVSKKLIGVGDWTGSFGEKILAKESMCYRIPDNMSYEKAVLLEPYCVGLHAVRISKVAMNDTIGIIGAGTIGLMTLVAAEASGRKSSFIFDLSETKLEAAKKLGATYTFNSGNVDPVEEVKKHEPLGLDIVYLAVPSEKAFDQALKMTKPQGKIVLIAVYGANVPIDSFQIQQFERCVMGTAMYNRDDYEMAIEQFRYNRINFSNELISNKITLEESHEVVREMAEGKRNEDIKNIIVFK